MIFFILLFYRLEKSSRSHSSEETETNRRQLPKKPQRQSNIIQRDDREPTPDYDSTGDKHDKSPLGMVSHKLSTITIFSHKY